MRNGFRIALAFFLALASRAHAQPVVAIDQPPEIESQVPGEIQIVRWSVLLNQTGADAVKKILQPIQTASKGYEGYSCNGYELRSAITDANAAKGVEGFEQNTDYARFAEGSALKMFSMSFFDSYKTDQSRAQVDGQPKKSEETFARLPGNRLHIKLNDSQISAGMIADRRQKQFPDLGSIQYDDDLSAGDAIAFMVPLAGPSKAMYYHMIVFETFKAEQVIADLVGQYRDAQWWCQNGPAAARKLAGPATVWEAAARHAATDVPVDFEKTLDDGKEISLIGFCQPSVARLCWWDARGKPVLGIPRQFIGITAANPTDVIVLFQIKGPASEYLARDPATQPVDSANFKYADSYLDYRILPIKEAATEITATVPIGRWQEAAQMNVGESKEIDGVIYQFATPKANGKESIQTNLQFSGPLTEYLPALTAVGPDAKEAHSFSMTYSSPILFADDMATQSFWTQLEGLPLKDVQCYRLWRRKLQTVTFKNFAQQPLMPVKAEVTPDDVAAAIKKLQDRAAGPQSP